MEGNTELLKYHYSDLDSKTTDQLTMSGALRGTVTNFYSGGVFESTQFKWNNQSAYTLTTNYDHFREDWMYYSDSSEHNSYLYYDEFGRVEQYIIEEKRSGLISDTFTKSYEYETLSNGSQTNQISNVSDGSDHYEYSYSDGRLTTVKKNGVAKSTYLYDINQKLTWEIQPDLGIDQQYVYDKDNLIRVGNTVTAETYETYGYTENLLTSHTKNNIKRYFEYDEMGNPTYYKTNSLLGEANMEWEEGRNIKERNVKREYV